MELDYWNLELKIKIMARVKKAVNALKTRRNILRQVKGYRFARSKKERAAYEALMHAGAHAFRDRRDKKGTFRRLWNIKINAALSSTALGTSGQLSYSKFIGALKKKNIAVDRKILADLAENNQATFARIVESVK